MWAAGDLWADLRVVHGLSKGDRAGAVRREPAQQAVHKSTVHGAFRPFRAPAAEFQPAGHLFVMDEIKRQLFSIASKAGSFVVIQPIQLECSAVACPHVSLGGGVSQIRPQRRRNASPVRHAKAPEAVRLKPQESVFDGHRADCGRRSRILHAGGALSATPLTAALRRWTLDAVLRDFLCPA